MSEQWKPVSEQRFTLVIKDLTRSEAEEVARLLREIAERDPTRQYYCIIQGLKPLPNKETEDILKGLFPQGGTAS